MRSLARWHPRFASKSSPQPILCSKCSELLTSPASASCISKRAPTNSGSAMKRVGFLSSTRLAKFESQTFVPVSLTRSELGLLHSAWRVGARALGLPIRQAARHPALQLRVTFVGNQLQVTARFIEPSGVELKSSEVNVHPLPLDLIMGNAQRVFP